MLSAPLPTPLQNARDLAIWGLDGAPPPPPPIIKQAMIASYLLASGYDRFVETGTYLGHTTFLIASLGVEVDTIELGENHYSRAQRDFADNPRVRCHFGDSTDVLPKILAELQQPALFWLDGHYSAGDTALGKKTTPIEEELFALREHPIRDHIILVDDIRGFGGNGYPEVAWLAERLAEIVPGAKVELKNDALIAASPVQHQRAEELRQEALQKILS